MIKALFILFVLAMHVFISQPEQSPNPRIIWGSKELSWKDFKAVPDVGSPDSAHLFSIIHIQPRYIKKDSLIVIVEDVFMTDKSWTKTLSDTILEHEKKLFDIAEIQARKMRKVFAEKTFMHSSLSKEINTVYTTFQKENETQQKMYEKETHYSKNREQQLIWNKKINEALKETDAYSNMTIPLNIDWKK